MALGDGYRWGSPTVHSNDLVARAAYAAGIIDGEGYIGIKCSERAHVQRSRSHRVYVAVGNTDEGMIEFLNNNFGGSVEYKEFPEQNRAPMWRWRTSAKNAVDFLKFIYPYLITKKEQAEVAFALQETMNDVNKGKGLSEETLKLRDTYLDRIHVLNKRGG